MIGAVAESSTCTVLQPFRVHAPKLEFYNHVEVLTPETVHFLFRNFPDLKSPTGFRYAIHFETFLNEPWICSAGLETLHCRIFGLDRFVRSAEDAYYKQMDYLRKKSLPIEYYTRLPTHQNFLREYKSRHEQQRRVLHQLSRFTNLKVLDLGREKAEAVLPLEDDGDDEQFPVCQAGYTIAYGRRTDTLELTLESGLDELASLKDLEVFGFEGIDHRIGKKELEWMAVNWPKLKEIRGLCYNPRVYVAQRWELEKYMKTLRPDVKHRRTVVKNSRITQYHQVELDHYVG
ncbi:hypothetical protein BGX23_005980 [Mortierella sp. AD031]|nr:hypothetical protein BGX23_005980 [Mortierella sp. AD031]